MQCSCHHTRETPINKQEVQTGEQKIPPVSPSWELFFTVMLNIPEMMESKNPHGCDIFTPIRIYPAVSHANKSHTQKECDIYWEAASKEETKT